ncbi:AimR family lysis-lysogeny pheromone receptor [Bacillus cereus]|nr:AimR family lysis-lysogeny pheromone receptor [Bacillus cereus]MDA2130012.1 AimR family lysis-lysogeny pheromone receptor [Bacillus cereus]MDA2152513.1 AimR family lysis-lysogeny pheromone receptor [Bacillus cereus]
MDTLSLLIEIHSDMKKRGITDIQVKDELNVSKGLVSQYFSGATKISFINFVKLVRYMYEEESLVQKYMLRFCEATSKPLNLCIAMEFASSQSNIELLNAVVARGKSFRSKMVKEWSLHYEFLSERAQGDLVGKKLFTTLSKSTIKSTYAEMKVLKSIILMYSFSDMQEFTSLIKTVPYVENEQDVLENQNEEEVSTQEDQNEEEPTVESLKEGYFKDAYDIRMKELQLVANLMDNNIEIVREIGQEVIQKEISKEFPRFLASIYEFLGISYMFEDIFISQVLIQKGIEILKNENTMRFNDKIEECQQTLDFIQINYEIDLDKINPADLGEKAHLAIKRGNIEEGIQILNDIKEDKGSWTAFQWYYMGLATGEEYYFRQSVLCFEQHGNKFYAQIPKRFIRDYL